MRNTSLAVVLLALTAVGAALPAAAYDRETPVVKAVRKVSPAVVNVSNQSAAQLHDGPFAGMPRNDLNWFFRDFFDRSWPRRQPTTQLGSGVIIDGRRGFILTNAHVVAQAGQITVTLMDERRFEAQLVGSDPDSDLAVLRIPADHPLPSVAMGSCNDLMIGENVIAIGNPFGFSHTVTTGVISAVKRSFRADEREYHDFLQIDASINPGNSGGPLLNINGELIGINTAIYAKAQGIGFAIPIDRAKRIVDDLIRFGEVIQAWIGLRVQPLDERLAVYLKLEKPEGVLIRVVEAGSPAQKAGIKTGDVLKTIDGQATVDTDTYRYAARGVSANQHLRLEVWRDGRLIALTLKAGTYPPERAFMLAEELLGIAVEDLTALNRRRFHLEFLSGVVVTEVHPDTYLARVGVEPGDVVRQIGDTTVENLANFQKALVKQRLQDSLVLLIQRGNRGYYITVEL